MKASSFFTREQQDQILAAVREAEAETSGEIRVHIETSFRGNVLDRAAWLFNRLGMQKTAGRNGILFYLAVENREFAVIGDAGIHAKVHDGFWKEISDSMTGFFREGRFTEGLVMGILTAGRELKTHFPHMADDVNELPDDISFDKVKGEK